MPTILLSGPVDTRPQTVSALRTAGATVANDPGDHGYPDHPDGTVDSSVAFITVDDPDGVDRVQALVAPFGWALRAHWERSGPWQKLTPLAVPDPAVELERLKTQLRAAGIRLPEVTS